MMGYAAEVSQGERFEFCKYWNKSLAMLDEEGMRESNVCINRFLWSRMCS
jgi:hypothetical protein